MKRVIVGISTMILAWYFPLATIHAENEDMISGTKITAEKMVTENKKNIIRFFGNVVAVSKEMTLKSQKLEVFSDKDHSMILKIVATGDVVITRGNREATGRKAELYNAEKKLVITGNATITEKDHIVTGEKIIYFYDKEDIIVSGGAGNRASVTLAPPGKNGTGEGKKE